MSLIDVMHVVGTIGTVCGLVLLAVWIAGRR